MARTVDIYLDIETDWERNITVLGFRSAETGMVQLVGKDANRTRLVRELPKQARLFTFNGHSFDLVVIIKRLKINLRTRFDSYDLRWECFRAGHTGGQKLIEGKFGIQRTLPDLDGRDAMRLWASHQRGNANALKTLLKYNAEDLSGLMGIRKHLRRSGHRDI